MGFGRSGEVTPGTVCVLLVICGSIESVLNGGSTEVQGVAMLSVRECWWAEGRQFTQGSIVHKRGQELSRPNWHTCHIWLTSDVWDLAYGTHRVEASSAFRDVVRTPVEAKITAID